MQKLAEIVVRDDDNKIVGRVLVTTEGVYWSKTDGKTFYGYGFDDFDENMKKGKLRLTRPVE